MKKLLQSLAVVCFGFVATTNAQTILTQNFSGATVPNMPSGWTNVNYASGSTAGPGWTTTASSTTLYEYAVPADDQHLKYATVNEQEYYVDSAQMTSPSFSLSGTTLPYLSYDYSFFEFSDGTTTEHAWVDVSTNGGTSWTTVDSVSVNANTIWETKYVNLSAYAGQANCKIRFVYSDGGDGLVGVCIGNISVFNSSANDLALQVVYPVAGDANNFFATGSSVPLSGTVANIGSVTVTTYGLSYQIDGGSVVTNNISGVSIAPYSSYNFTDPTSYTAGAPGVHAVKMWVSLNGDNNHANDTMTSSINVADSLVPKLPLIEEFNQASCDPCADAAPNVDSVYANNYGTSILVRYHVDWPGTDYMDDETLAPFVQNRITYYGVNSVPDAKLDGIDIYPGAGSGGLSTAAIQSENAVPTAFDLSLSNVTYNNTTKVYTATASVKSHVVMPAGLSLRAALAVDSIRYLANQSTESIPQYFFPQVAENMFPNGNGNTLTAFTVGQTQNVSISWTKNHPWGSEPSSRKYDSSMSGKIVIWLQDDANHQNVYQAAYANVSTTWTTGVTPVTGANGSLNIYPNPASQTATIALNLTNAASVKMQIVNMLGQVVYSAPAANMDAGITNTTVNLSNFASGEYFVNIAIGNDLLSKKLVVTK